jgi:two-component system cell cycle response regulator
VIVGGKVAVDTLRVRWLASPLAPQLVRALAAEQVKLVSDDDPCDVVVVDADAWPHQARAAATGGSAPTMLLVSTSDDHDLDTLLGRLPATMVVESRATHPALLARRLRQLGTAPDVDIDPLTGLINRRGLQRWLRRHEGQELVVVEFDVDRMKQLNDTWGHDVGDRVLTEIGALLETYTPRGGIVARVGGDEFLVVNKRAETEPRLFGEYLRQGAALVSVPITKPDVRGSLSALLSAGVSYGRGDPESIVQEAHLAAVAAKARGRDRTVEYKAMRDAASGSLEERAFEDMTMVAAQRAAETIASGGRRMFSLLRDEADTDSLTSLPNRRYFNKKLEWEMRVASEQGTPLSLVWVDIDHFGDFNKRFSYAVGDSVLRHVATTLRDHVGDVGWVARWGGEEFAIVLGGYPLELAVELAERLRALVEVEDFVPEDRRQLHVTISAGVAEWAPGEQIIEVVERISQAVGIAKEKRNTVWPPMPTLE